MADNFSVATTAYSRVFLIEGRARADHSPVYESCLRMQGLTRNFGDIESIECPDPQNYGKFIEIGQIRGTTERATTTLEGRFAADLRSTLMRLASEGCAIDVQLHLGSCTDPSAFNSFTKAIVLENALLSSYNTDELGALESGDQAAVNENAEISAENLYEIMPLTFSAQAGSLVTNEIIDALICDTVTCGECDTESDGCQKMFLLSIAAGGSPSTPPDVIYTIDGGSNWYAHDIDSMSTTEDPSGFDCVGDYLVIVSEETSSLHYALKSEFDGYTDPDFTEIATGIVNAPRAIWSYGRGAFVVGNGGYIYETTDPTAGVEAIDAGNATIDDLLVVHGLSSGFAVAAGENGVVVYTEDGSNWTEVTLRPVGASEHITALWVRGENDWQVGTDAGNAYYTLNKGETWTAMTFPGTGSGRVDAIAYATDSVGYLAHATTTPRGRILRTYDGGQSWQVMPEGTATLALNDRVNALAVCGDANVILGGGLGDDASDGYAVLGKAT